MMSYPDLQLCIGGDWKDADGHPVINPADESEIGTVPFAGRPELDAVLAAAQEGFQIWRRTSPTERAEIILKAARLIRERVDEMAVAKIGRASCRERVCQYV